MLDELDRAGPGGHFLETEETLGRFRDFWYPGLLDRSRRERWLAKGSTTLGMRLNDRVKDIIEDHRPRALDADKKRKVQEVLSAAGV
jgi:trimethylamine--corrinoid protein Co-methyltransferase